jgi:PIN domain nuclease of toxin-antitoxin system
MNEIIIDTIVLDYLTRNKAAIPKSTLAQIESADIVYVCVSSLWELSNHVRDGLIPLNVNFILSIKMPFKHWV